jgi:hypothetical protein
MIFAFFMLKFQKADANSKIKAASLNCKQVNYQLLINFQRKLFGFSVKQLTIYS